jgi:hypothetical protein
MAKIKLNPAVAALSGKIGDMVHRRLWGQQIISHLPDFSQQTPSERQVAQVQWFKTGAVKWNSLPSEVKDRYKARAKELQMPPCGLYQKTNAHPPSVEGIDLSQYTGEVGQTIRVAAVDLVEIAGVEVIIRQAGGEKLEAGSAVQSADGTHYWTYQTKAAVANPAGVTVEAIAVNWPGQRATRMQMLGTSST